jgi:hypothetical protein
MYNDAFNHTLFALHLESFAFIRVHLSIIVRSYKKFLKKPIEKRRKKETKLCSLAKVKNVLFDETTKTASHIKK